MFFSFDYMMFMLPAMVLAGLAAWFTRSTFRRYERVASYRGLTGAEAAAHMLAAQGVRDVRIEPVRGFLSDHYDPLSRTLRLSPAVYGSSSLSAIGVACHEAGHALQHAAHYGPLVLRTAMVPAVQFGSNASYFMFIFGLLLGLPMLVKVGVVAFAAVVLFSLVTLPVEWDATRRARGLMTTAGIVLPEEATRAGQVLNAAFLTYVASAFTAILELLYLLMRSGLLGGRDD